MTTRPTVSPLFATDATLGTGSESALAPRLDPGAGVRARGLLANNRAPARWFNYLLGLSGDWLSYLTEKSDHQFNVLNYGADASGVADSTSAIQAAITAAVANYGDVIFPPGTYLHTGLTVPDGVNIYAAQGAELFNTGAGASLVFTQSNEGPPSLVEGLRFHASTPNTANAITNNADARAIFRRCSFNGYANGGGYFTNLQGKIAATNSALSELLFVDCDMVVGGTVKGLHATLGSIRMLRGSLRMPASYADALAYADSSGKVMLDEVEIDLRAHTTGTAQVLYGSSSSGFSALRNCVIDGTGAGGTIYGHLWVPDALVSSHGNLYLGNTVTPYGNSRAAVGSRVQLEDSLAIDIGTASTVDLSNSGRFRSILVKGEANCVVTLPSGLFVGHELLYTHFNADVSGHSVSFAVTPLTAQAIPGSGTLGAGNTLSTVLVWESRDVSGSYRWVQKGAWGVGLTLV